MVIRTRVGAKALRECFACEKERLCEYIEEEDLYGRGYRVWICLSCGCDDTGKISRIGMVERAFRRVVNSR